MQPAIEIENVSKIYGRGRREVKAVDAVSLSIQPGQVFGLLGPNGAGKTTLIRMLLDLIRPTAGKLRIFGRDVGGDHAVLRQVGAIVEGPAAYPYMTGRDNLKVLARVSGRADTGRIDALLKQVGLGDRADRPVRGYSLGMKQRLGLAAALLDDPQLIILDEPANGLDPAGMAELRIFIRELVEKQGKSVLLSSHLLNEVEQICDRVAIINKGKIVREATIADMLTANATLRIDAEPREGAIAALHGGWTLANSANGAIEVNAARDQVPAIVRALVAANVDVYSVGVQHQTLEHYFFEATGEPNPANGATRAKN